MFVPFGAIPLSPLFLSLTIATHAVPPYGTSTFRRWLKSDQAFLEANGVTTNTKILPPKVVKYICEKYCIELKD